MGKRKREDEGNRNLLRDASLGTDILNKWSQNCWWDGSNGSRLVFLEIAKILYSSD